MVTLPSLISLSTIAATTASSAPATLPSFWTWVQLENTPMIAAVSPTANKGVHDFNTSRIYPASASVWPRSIRSNRVRGVRPYLEYWLPVMSWASVCAGVLNTWNVTSSSRDTFRKRSELVGEEKVETAVYVFGLHPVYLS